MPNISRRRFLRNASIGAAATGVAAAGGLSLLTGVSGADAATPPKATSPEGPVLDGSGVVAHVVDAKSGKISLFVGTKHIDYTNQALAQELLKATK
jgi:hypothetical protein